MARNLPGGQARTRPGQPWTGPVAPDSPDDDCRSDSANWIFREKLRNRPFQAAGRFLTPIGVKSFVSNWRHSGPENAESASPWVTRNSPDGHATDKARTRYGHDSDKPGVATDTADTTDSPDTGTKASSFLASRWAPFPFLMTIPSPLLLQTGDLEGYQHHRERMIRQFSGTPDSVIAERIAKDCLILPPPAADFETIGKMANTALVVDSTHKGWGDVYFVKGLAEYRQGHFASAVEWLQKVLPEKRPWTRNVQTHMVLAMAHHQLHQPDDARATLATGLKTADRTLEKLNEGLDDDWNDWIIAHLLMNQAQALIEDKPKPPNDTK